MGNRTAGLNFERLGSTSTAPIGAVRYEEFARQLPDLPALRTFVGRASPLWILPLAEAVAIAGLRDEATEWLERFLPTVKAKWEEAGRQLADLGN